MPTTPTKAAKDRKLNYNVNLTIGEKRAIVGFISKMRVVDIPACIDVVQLRKAYDKIKEA